MDLLSTGLLASIQDTAPGTYSQQSGCFSRWCKLKQEIGINNKDLDGLNHSQKIGILSVFCESVRRNENGKRKFVRLAGDMLADDIHNEVPVHEDRLLQAVAAGLKAYTTWEAVDTLQVCRECTGGMVSTYSLL